MDLLKHAPVAFAWEILCRDHPQAEDLVVLKWDSALKSQSYRIDADGSGIQIAAADDAGFLYGLLDLTDIWDTPLVLQRTVTPDIPQRGIKFNIPLDARTPSYSDASDSAFENISQMWDMSFWEEFLDQMALHKFNVLTLWSLSPFPSLVRIPEYPKIALEDVMASNIPPRPEMSGENMYTPDMTEGLYPVKRITMDGKIAFWRQVMAYAADRCIRVYLFTWNLFVYGTEGNCYGITCDQGNPITRDYVYRGTKALLETYPLLAGIGITSGEHMKGDSSDIPFLRQTYGRAVEECNREYPERKLELIHRMQYARYQEIVENFSDLDAKFTISFKYSQAHMHAWEKPDFFDIFQRDFPMDRKVWFTVRDDDYYLYRWGGLDFARDYLANMPKDQMEGFYLGADGFTWGRDYTGWGDSHELYLNKMWFKFDLLGQLAYDGSKTDDYFKRKLSKRFDCDAGPVLALWQQASSIFNHLHATHWNDYDFQWYPEGCCRFLHPPVGKLVFSDINEFVACPSMPGTPFLSVKDYCACILNGETPQLHTPLETVIFLRSVSRRVLEQVGGLLTSAKNPELRCTAQDIKALGLLGKYYADKLEAAVELCFFRMNGDERHHETAVILLRKAASSWKHYSEYSTSLYRPQRLTRFGGRYVDFRFFNRAAELDVELAQLQ